MLNEQRLTCIEIVQKLPSFRYVVPVAGKASNPLLLLSYAPFALGNMPLGLLQMVNVHCAITKSVGHGTAPIPMQAGAQLVSQPPTPTGRALAGDEENNSPEEEWLLAAVDHGAGLKRRQQPAV